MNFIRNKMNNDSGFTLIEMVLVALMVLILATMAIASMRRAREAGLETAAQKALKSLAESQEMFYQDNYDYADDFSQLLQRYLPRTYTDADRSNGFIRSYSVLFQVNGTPVLGTSRIAQNSVYPNYTIYAVPLASNLSLRTYWITQSARVSDYVALP
ncbi:prepilin-type N-terminal cleavage/methylation domain-containing protein [bacterium]|nr:prepilin-type N-terminal cleavage/methylation domain-containing protein [bacterium]